jgi:hypothetical protein
MGHLAQDDRGLVRADVVHGHHDAAGVVDGGA